MKEEIFKRVNEYVKFPQHTKRLIETIIENEVGNLDILCNSKFLKRAAVEITLKLATLGLVTKQQTGLVYLLIVEAMGVYDIAQ